MENRGQVTDASGNLRPDVLFAVSTDSAKLYFSANAIHYQFTKMEYLNGYDPRKKEPANDFRKEEKLQKHATIATRQFSLELQGTNGNPEIITDK